MTCNQFTSPIYTLSSISLSRDELTNAILNDSSIAEFESRPLTRYDSNTVISNINSTVQIFNAISNKSDFPMISMRIEQSPILPDEYAEFLSSSGLSADIVESTLIVDSQVIAQSNTVVTSADLYSTKEINYLSQLEYYYNDNMAASITGGFCSAFYQALDTLSQLQSLANSAATVIDDITNFGLTNYLSTFSQINSILSILINELGIKELERLHNLLLSANETILKTIATAQLIERRIQQAQQFFSEENLNLIKERVEALIASFATNYEEITPEVLAYLMHRFCQLTETITILMQSPTNSINDLITKTEIAYTTLLSFSNQSRLNAVNSGLTSISSETRNDLITQSTNGINGQSSNDPTSPTNYVPPGYSTAEVNEAQAAKNPSGNVWISWSSRGVINIIPRLEAAGRSTNGISPGDGYNKLKITRAIGNNSYPGVLLIAIRVAKRMNKRITVTSAYRPLEFNSLVGGAGRSLHTSGDAMDISMSNFTEEEKALFVMYASQEGAGGISYYRSDNFTHIDTGTVRTWTNPGGEVENAMNMHLQGKYRQGALQPLPTTFAQSQPTVLT